MKRILLGILVFTLVVSCGPKPETVVSKFIDSVKEKKIEEASKYVINKDFRKDLKLEYDNKMQQLFFETLFKNMKYEIISSEKREDMSIVTVSVENVDTEKVFVMIFQRLLKNAFSDSENGQTPPIEEEFKKILESNDVPKEKNTTKFIVVKTKEGNKINVTAENLDVLFGKVNTTFSNLNTLGTGPEENEAQLPQEGWGAGKDQKLTEPKLDKK